MSMKLVQEFKKFAVKGNMFDMAIGVVIGAAFSKVVDSLVKDIISPIIGALAGKVDFKEFKWVIQEAIVDDKGGVTQKEVAVFYGKFLSIFMDFFIVAISIFLVIKTINIIKEKAEDIKDLSVPTPKNIELLNDIKEMMNGEDESKKPKQ